MKGKNSKEVEVKRKIADSITIKVGQGIRTIFRDTDTLEKAKKISILFMLTIMVLKLRRIGPHFQR